MSTKRMNLNEYKWEAFYEEFQQESPRAAVIVSGAFLDALLRDLLASFMIESDKAVDELLGSDKNPDTPLSSFGARVKTAYCLGLINKMEYHDLSVVRKMRNKFAHKLHGYTFENEEIVKLCDSLRFPELLRDTPSTIIQSHSDRFVFTVSMLSSQLAIKILSIEKERRIVPKDLQTPQYIRVEADSHKGGNTG